MNGWEEWPNLSPEEHALWMAACTQECIEVEIAELIKRAASGKKVKFLFSQYSISRKIYVYCVYAWR